MNGHEKLDEATKDIARKPTLGNAMQCNALNEHEKLHEVRRETLQGKSLGAMQCDEWTCENDEATGEKLHEESLRLV
jgi:hypothetical protein